jgi:hypothetical protein
LWGFQSSQWMWEGGPVHHHPQRPPFYVCCCYVDET